MRRNADFQVLIAGGGLIGASFALALGRAGLQVALLEQRRPPPYIRRDEYDLRVSAVSLSSQYIWSNLGVWSAIADIRVSPYRRMHVWDAAGTGSVEFDCTQYQLENLGHIVENALILNQLMLALAEMPNVTLLCPAEVSEFAAGARVATIGLASGDRLHAQLVVAADGGDSRLRDLAGIETDTWSYHQRGVVTTVRSEQPHAATAWQRFLPSGPLALLPLADGSCSIVWSTSDAEAARLLALNDDAFCRELTDASAARLGAILTCGERAAFPLRYCHARRYCSRRLALIGDAAHVVHPLAGQGVNLGMLDVAYLAGQLIDVHRGGGDCGDNTLLARYQRRRRTENQAMAQAFDGLNRLFSNRRASLALLRNTGLALVDQSTMLKRFFIQRATGLAEVLRASALYQTGKDNASLLVAPEYLDESYQQPPT